MATLWHLILNRKNILKTDGNQRNVKHPGACLLQQEDPGGKKGIKIILLFLMAISNY